MEAEQTSRLTALEVRSLQDLLPEYREEVIDRLKMVESVENLSSRNQLRVIGWLVDHGADIDSRIAISAGIDLAKDLDPSSLDAELRGMLNYRLGTAYSNRMSLEADRGDEWLWENTDREHAIRHYRLAIQEDTVDELSPLEQWRSFTNLGNLYSAIGRFVEAFDFWNEALIRQPYFFPARGQRGIGFYTYGRHDYDEGHRAVLLKKAYDEIEKAKMDRLVGLSPEKTLQQFDRYQTRITAEFKSSPPSDEILDFEESDLGDSDEERAYRRWGLRHRLFLNTLNDVTDEPIAAQDTLHLGQLLDARTERIVTCLGLWNHLVEEYVTARYLLYQGSHPDGPHFADKEVSLTNTLDYPVHSVYGEQLKIALRTAYSLFDKIAQFINYYFECGRDTEDVSFTDIWFQNRHGSTLQEKFSGRANLPLRGLYWLSKDLRDDSLRIENSLDLAGRELTELRNGVEHRYVKLTAWETTERPAGHFTDELATKMARDEFETKAVTMLRKTRAALIYLAFAVNLEEERKPSRELPAMPLEFGALRNTLQ